MPMQFTGFMKMKLKQFTDSFHVFFSPLVIGLGIVQVQAQDKPLRSHRLHQHCHRFS